MLAIFLYMYFPAGGVYTPYSPCMSTPLNLSTVFWFHFTFSKSWFIRQSCCYTMWFFVIYM